MSLRDTTGKPTLRQKLEGDSHLAERLAGALGAMDAAERATHGFHTYPAGLHPDAARDILKLFPGDSILDPFCGGGCVLVEGRIAGRKTYGRDLSTVALRVSRARCSTPDDELLTQFRSTSRKLAEYARKNPQRPPPHVERAIQDWYAPHAAGEIQALLTGIREVESMPVRRLLTTVLSSILVKVSWRKSDTSARREKHHRPRGTTSVLFHKKARELARRMVALRELVPEGTPDTELDLQDARRVRVPHPVDLILTSPPYPAVYDYLPMQHLRSIWLGEARSDVLEQEIGPRRSWRTEGKEARKRWVRDTASWMESASKCLNPGGHLVIVIGDGLTPTGTVDTVSASQEGANKAGLELVARASLLRPDHARDSGRWEHVFAFQRPSEM